MPKYFGFDHCKDRSYGAAAALSYWAFLCRDRNQTPAKGLETWNYLTKAIRQSTFSGLSLEAYLAELCKRLVVPSLRPAVLTHKIVCPEQIVFRVPVEQVAGTATPNFDLIQQRDVDQSLSIYSWQDILAECQQHGFGERDILSNCKSQSTIVSALCRFKHIELFGERSSEADEQQAIDAIEVEVANVD